MALDDSARPQFNLLQNYRSEARRIRYFIFDLLCYDNRDTTSLLLVERRALLRKLKFQSPRIQFIGFSRNLSSQHGRSRQATGIGRRDREAKR